MVISLKIINKLVLNIFILSFLFFIILENNLNASNRYTMKDVSGVAVFVENLSNFISKKDLNLESLEKKASKRLEDSRVRVYEKSQWYNNAGAAYIKFKIITSKFINFSSFVVYIDAEFYRPVALMSKYLGKNESIAASTWSVGKLFSCSEKDFQLCIQMGVNDLADIFISEYKAVNGLN